MERYILIPYSEAEEFENIEGCYFIFNPIPEEKMFQLLFLKKNIVKRKDYHIRFQIHAQMEN